MSDVYEALRLEWNDATNFLFWELEGYSQVVDPLFTEIRPLLGRSAETISTQIEFGIASSIPMSRDQEYV